MGTHIYMPLSNSIGMSFATAGELGKKLGRMNAVNTLALVVSSAVLWILFKFLHISYMTSFAIGAVAFVLAAITLIFIETAPTVKKSRRFVFRKEYRLYNRCSVYWQKFEISYCSTQYNGNDNRWYLLDRNVNCYCACDDIF